MPVFLYLAVTTIIMITNLYTLLLLLLILPCTAQQYDFDYVQECHVTLNGEKEGGTLFRFFNSNDDSYSLRVSLFGENVYMTLYLDDGKYYHDTISKEDFFVYGISMKCPKSGLSSDFRDKDPDDFTYHKLPDTLINTTSYSHVRLFPSNIKNIIMANYLLPIIYWITASTLILQSQILTAC